MGPAPDLVFLDVSLPGIGGLEVLELIRAQDADLAVVMMTGLGSEEVAAGALRRGADDYLRKPFARQEFQAVLDRTVARLDLRRQNAALQRQLDEERRHLAAELARAGEIQVGLLPAASPAIPGFDLAGCCVPAREVGGDFYDWHAGAGGTVVFSLGDVMGKGMPAALVMATVRAALHAVGRLHPPATAVALAAEALETDLNRSGGFVTLFHAQLDPPTRCLTFVDAGHGYVFLRRASGGVEALAPRGLPLGVLGVAEEGLYEAGELRFEPGDALVVYSDGLIDADPSLHLDPADLAAAISPATTAAQMVARLVALPGLRGAPPDDLTVAVLRCRAPGEEG